MTPISDDRLAEIDDDMRQFGYVDNDMAAELLAEVHRLRTLPPEVADAMECFENTGGFSCSFPEECIEQLMTIAAHFTKLFQKGA